MAKAFIMPRYSYGRHRELRKPHEVDRPDGTWVSYTWLWENYRVSRGRLDRMLLNGEVHWIHEGEQLYRREDIEDRIAELVERALVAMSEQL